jgi:hypothetical protein
MRNYNDKRKKKKNSQRIMKIVREQAIESLLDDSALREGRFMIIPEKKRVKYDLEG